MVSGLKRPLVVGLTGHFGAGKSTVARMFKKKGARVISADELAHEVFLKRNPLAARIRSIFPEVRGGLDRKKIARLVFRNAKRRQALERLIHPYVFRRAEEEIRRSHAGVILLEVPLLFESGFDRHCDRTIVVRTRAREVLKRLRAKGFQGAEVRARWRAQRDRGGRIRRADEVIDNSNGLLKTKRQVHRIWEQLKLMRRERSQFTHGSRKK